MAKIKDLTKEIVSALEVYTTAVSEQIEKEKIDVAKEAVKELKQKSPKDTGEYSKGWKRSKVGTAQVVHNATGYSLTHLLERGHAKRGGGRVPGKPHISPVEQKAIDEFEKRVEKVIRG